ncbi:unnamed protein product [Phytophthora lilii]|uniref:Unnamed protein product n=1 Tax=Phytophthora lilii TaxID=2077276 RepID=A0A9W6TDH9_9STRA|nr:unnamed protein product [Phytophthora lilii]
MDEKPDKTVEATEDAQPHRIGVVQRVWRGVKHLWTTATVIPTLLVVLTGLAVFVLTMEVQIISYTPEVVVNEGHTCSPRVLDPKSIEYHSGHRFYSALKEMYRLPVPTFRGNHTVLCREDVRLYAKYGYCLPISGRKDTPFCTAADRTDLLNLRSHKSICYASVLHMLMVDVYEELQATGNTPLITFGSLLGAVRNGSVIPFTEDTDIGFVDGLKAIDVLQEELWRKGYHMFFLGIWRVCVAPTHPLAKRLYNSSLPLTKKYSVPYVDLYEMKKLGSGNWDVEELEGSNGRILPGSKVEPFSQVTINGMPFDTVQDPHFFLKEAYGPDYMTPTPRKSEHIVSPFIKKLQEWRAKFNKTG